MQSVVTGRASSRFIEISSSHFSQIPKVPFSMRASALSILASRNFSRSRRRKIIDWVYSLEARSISSGRSSVSNEASSVRVFFAWTRSWRFDSSSIVLNRFTSFLFKRAPSLRTPRSRKEGGEPKRRGFPCQDGQVRAAGRPRAGPGAARPEGGGGPSRSSDSGPWASDPRQMADGKLDREFLRSALALLSRQDVDRLLYVSDQPLSTGDMRGRPVKRKLVYAV